MALQPDTPCEEIMGEDISNEEFVAQLKAKILAIKNKTDPTPLEVAFAERMALAYLKPIDILNML